MVQFLFTTFTGWAAVLGLGVEIALPYWLRNARAWRPSVAEPAGPSPGTMMRDRMRPHVWLGYGLALLTTLHVTTAMTTAMARADAAGLWAATGAWMLVFAQLGLGMFLERSGGPSRRRVRRAHFVGMLALSALTAMHLWRNS